MWLSHMQKFTLFLSLSPSLSGMFWRRCLYAGERRDVERVLFCRYPGAIAEWNGKALTMIYVVASQLILFLLVQQGKREKKTTFTKLYSFLRVLKTVRFDVISKTWQSKTNSKTYSFPRKKENKGTKKKKKKNEFNCVRCWKCKTKRHRDMQNMFGIFGK